MNKKEIIVLVLLILAVITRFVFIRFGESAIPNFTAVGAMMIIGATYMKGMKRWIVPLAIFWISDLFINNVVYAQYYDSFQLFATPWVYLGYLLVGIIAYIIMKTSPSFIKLLLTCTTGAVIFFLVTNFGSWLHHTSPYTKDFSGLMASYQAGIPFFRNALMGDLFFGFVLFGLYDIIASRIESLKPMLFRKSLA